MIPKTMLLNRPRTKIVCTLGPATSSESIIEAMVLKGMSVARLNTSHGSLEEHREMAQKVRRVSNRLDIPVGVMVDVPGTKYRSGSLASGPVSLKAGDTFTLTSDPVAGNANRVSVTPPGIHLDATPGARIVLDDGLIQLCVDAVQGNDVKCTVTRGGVLTERRGVTVPGKTPSLPFPDERTKNALRIACEVEADFVAISTVVNAGQVEAVKTILTNGCLEPFIISKIERAEALANFKEILFASDGIMVARGDMGVELPVSDVPLIQKSLIAQSNVQGKPVITATQMLESMVRAPMPTRAEVADVANAIFDGTDAIMLSGETSIGEHPLEAIQMMAEIALKTEAALPYERILVEKRHSLEPQTDDAIAYAACTTAQQLNAEVIVAFTESGSTARRVSKYRPMTRILGMTPSEHARRKLTIMWGVTPLKVERAANVVDMMKIGEEASTSLAGLQAGAIIVLVAGVPIGMSGRTNLLRVLTISS